MEPNAKVVKSDELESLVYDYIRSVCKDALSVDVFVYSIEVVVDITMPTVNLRKQREAHIRRIVRSLKKLTKNMLGYDSFFDSYQNTIKLHLMHSYSIKG